MTTEPLNLRGRLYADEAPPVEKPANGTSHPPRPLHDHDAEHGPAYEAYKTYETHEVGGAYDLDGVEEPSEPQGFDPENAQLSAELPPGTALLCVKNTTYAGRPSFELYLHHRGRVRGANRPTDLDQRRQPGLGPARLVELGAKSGWRATYRHVKGWWRTETVLADWVDRLRAAENPRLVVWDHTAHEIPWELLYRQPLHESSPADTGGWIGAALPVIRWTTVYDASRAWSYDARPRHCRGGVLVYEDPEFAVASDGVRRHEVGERSTTMRHLHARLRDKASDFGLLLMRCHGKYSEDVDEFTLGGVSFPELDEDWRMPALRATGAAVLINSCVSARPVVDRRYNAAVPRNFAEIFLRWGAGAVIATLAEVSKVHAHDFAARLVRNAQRGPVNLADALTAHRADYAREAERAVVEGDDRRAEAAVEGFFTSFMYAYFGHPGTTLALEAQGRPEGDEAP